MATSDDAGLNARLTFLRQTDAAAFMEVLFKTYYQPLGSVVYRVVPDRAVVEDLVQDVFLKIWQERDTLPVIDSYRAYLVRMALNAALRYQQRQRRQVDWEAVPPDAAPVAPDALDGLYATETAAAVAAALTRLPPQCRIIFELSRYEELSYQQIAEALELSPKTVENQMGKALRILRRELAGVLKNLYWLLLYLFAARTAASPPAEGGRANSVRSEVLADFPGGRGGNAGPAYPLFVSASSSRKTLYDA